MSEYFRGWRRKTGLVALLIACAMTSGWLRSRVKFDLFAFEIKRFSIQLISTDELLGFQAFWLTKPSTKSNLRFISGRDNSKTVHTGFTSANFRGRFPQFPVVPLPRTWDIQRELDVGRFRVVAAKASWNDIQFIELRVPYWMIVLSLTLVSAGLLFSKRRQESRSSFGLDPRDRNSVGSA